MSDPNFGKTDALIAFHRLDTSESIFRFIQTLVRPRNIDKLNVSFMNFHEYDSYSMT